MARSLLILIAIAALIVFVASLGRLIGAAAQTTKEASVPQTVKKISYALLVVLMFGVVTGRLGGL